MPQPIIPIHQQESMPITFGESLIPGFQLSELQSILLQSAASSKPNLRTSMNVVTALEEIDKNTDFIVTAVTDSSERFCSVPNSIDDETLLSLKANGYISGNGRSVKITDRGRTALRDSYLKSSNSYRDNKVSEKFDYVSATRVAFKKVK